MTYELIPVRSVLLCSGVEFFDDSGGGVESGNVGNLSSELLMLGADATINALDLHKNFDSVLEAFEDVQKATSCSTGCGGCYQQVLDIISEIMMGK